MTTTDRSKLRAADAAVRAAWNIPHPDSRQEDYWDALIAKHEALIDAFDELLPLVEHGSGAYYAVIDARAGRKELRDHAQECAAKLRARAEVSS